MPKRSDHKGKVIVLVAPSGAGKTSLSQRLIRDFPHIVFSVSATTRKPRNDEKSGIDYHFLSWAGFQEGIDNDRFLEWEEFYDGTRYGTLFSEVEKNHNSGYYTLLDIEVNGAINIKKIYGDDCLSVFIKPPSLNVLRERLENRGTENENSLKLRLERAEHELAFEHRFDQVIVNDDFEQAYRELKQVVKQYIHSFSKG
ncbi:MAG: guanylate kinase [Balneolales bacterium]